jgi:hypothetical protein
MTVGIVPLKLGLGDSHGLIEVVVGQCGVEDGTAVLGEEGRLQAPGFEVHLDNSARTDAQLKDHFFLVVLACACLGLGGLFAPADRIDGFRDTEP